MNPFDHPSVGVVLQRHRKHRVFSKINVSPRITYAEMMVKLRDKYSQDVHGPLVTAIQKHLLCQDLVIEIIPKSSIIFADVESVHQAARVFLGPAEVDMAMTEAFHHPDLMKSRLPFAQILPELCTWTGAAEEKVIPVRRVISKTGVSILVLLDILIFVGVGIAIELITHKLELSVEVSTGLFVVLQILQGIAAWVLD